LWGAFFGDEGGPMGVMGKKKKLARTRNNGREQSSKRTKKKKTQLVREGKEIDVLTRKGGSKTQKKITVRKESGWSKRHSTQWGKSKTSQKGGLTHPKW